MGFILKFFSGLSFTQILLGLVTASLLGMSVYCKSLKSENTTLSDTLAQKVLIISQKDDAIKLCSDNTEKLKKEGETLSSNAIAAIAIAKVEAVKDYKDSQTILIRKPKPVVVTPDNAKDFGGEDKSVQLTDYLSTQDLVNEYIDNLRLKK